MIVKIPEGRTRNMGAPKNWDGNLNGHCGILPIADVVINELPFMLSAWEPTPYELELLNKGASVHLYVQGQAHPVVSVCVGEPPK